MHEFFSHFHEENHQKLRSFDHFYWLNWIVGVGVNLTLFWFCERKKSNSEIITVKGHFRTKYYLKYTYLIWKSLFRTVKELFYWIKSLFTQNAYICSKLVTFLFIKNLNDYRVWENITNKCSSPFLTNQKFKYSIGLQRLSFGRWFFFLTLFFV